MTKKYTYNYYSHNALTVILFLFDIYNFYLHNGHLLPADKSLKQFKHIPSLCGFLHILYIGMFYS